LYRSSEEKVCKTNPHTLDELRNNTGHDISTICGKSSRKLKCSANILSAFGKEGKILSICCSIGEFLRLSKGYYHCDTFV
jgi:hypothetical protein